MKKITYAVIGCGGRISGLIREFADKKDVELKGGWDPSTANVTNMLEKMNNGEGKIYSSYEELVSDPEIDWVFIGSPNVFHKEHIIAAFAKGKQVFSEKPLATTIEDCIAINKSHQKSGKLFATGFTLRYASIYRKAKEILASGKLGKVISINACENIAPDHGAYIMKDWRRKKELAGPHILEKCVHDLDLINWFTESVPTKIAAFGGNNMFTPENDYLYRNDKKVFQSAWELVEESFEHAGNNPFLSDKTIEDNIVAIMEFANGVRVQFQATMSNAIPERRMYFHCSGGTLIVELYSGLLQYKSLADEAIQRIPLTGGGHGDGDYHIMKELHDSMINGTIPVCGGEEGLLSAVVGITIDEARENGTVIDLGEIWKSLGVIDE
ncbi:MAG: Gfo/Idh/MocA family oxidoreductase [Bacteroidetes bacterium]|nr:Gfo/Idh/MocA family oxidoreductase [Bacteroidota bacterium]